MKYCRSALSALVVVFLTAISGSIARDKFETLTKGTEVFVSEIVAKFDEDLQTFHTVEANKLESGRAQQVPDIVRKHQRLLQPTETGIQIQTLAEAVQQAEENVQNALKTSRLSQDTSKLLNTQLDSAKLRFIDLIFGKLHFCWPISCIILSKYRTINGECNNLVVNRHWGQAERPHNRWLPAAYQGNLCHGPRVNGVSGALPNARQVSRVVHDTLVSNHPHITHMVMQWGQFLDHDITLTPMFVGTSYGGGINCDCNVPITDRCFPIDLDINDPLHDVDGNNGCIRMIRSKPAVKCEFWNCVREQENEITSYIDASNVYGSSASVANSLKDGSDPNKLEVETPSFPGGAGCPVVAPTGPTNCKHFLPNAGDPKCEHCFKAGDIRNSEQPALASMHTIWVREHNWVVDQLTATGFNGNKYEEARRIVGAMHMHITYNEFLRAVLGDGILASNGLAPLVSGYSTYDKYCDATINNEFATAAYRFGHSLIQGMLEIIQNFDYSASSIENLHENFSPDFLIGDIMNIDKLLNGFVHQSAQRSDRFIDEDVRDRLFASLSNAINQFGMDLAALNIQRGRDHGIPGYVAYRNKFFSGPTLSTFSDLPSLMDSTTIAKLDAVYGNVADIDLFTGLLAETPVGGAIVGPLLAEMLVTQFKALKDCDRYYYEHKWQAGTFAEPRLNSIRSVRLSQVMCRNLPHLHQEGSLQRNVFLKEDSVTNPRLPCADILASGGVDFSEW